MTKIFVISGKAGSGKTTVVEAAMRDYFNKHNKNVLSIAFGDSLKFVLEKYLGWDGRKDANGRNLLQTTGTMYRDFDTDHWVSIVLKNIEVLAKNFDYIVVTDCRYWNEFNAFNEIFSGVRKGYDYIKNEIGPENVHNFFIVRENNGDGCNTIGIENNPELKKKFNSHASETGVDMIQHYIKEDHFIYNDAPNVTEARKKVIEQMKPFM